MQCDFWLGNQMIVADLQETVERSCADLRTLSGAQIFLTGGTGYIGWWLLDVLIFANVKLGLSLHVTVLSRNVEGFLRRAPYLRNRSDVVFIEGDIRNFGWPQKSYTHLIHAATDVVAVNPPLETFDVTVLGTRNVLNFARVSGVSRALLLSSGAVYGKLPSDVDRVAESHCGIPDLTSPASAYGLGKAVSEWLGTVYSGGKLSCSSARVFAQIGPRLPLDKQFAAGNFILNAIRSESLVIKGDGTPLRSYMYVTDLMVWLLAVLVRGAASRAYNVGSDVSISIRDLAEKIALASGRSGLNIIVQQAPKEGAPAERYVPDTERVRTELGLELAVSLDDALKRTLSWFSRHNGMA